MRSALTTVWRNPYIKVATLVLGLILAYRLAGAVQPAATIFIGAFILAYLVNPLVDMLQARKMPRGVGVAIVYILLFGTIYLMVVIATGSLKGAFAPDETTGLTMADNAAIWFESLPATLEERLPEQLHAVISSPLETLAELTADAVQFFAPRMQGVSAGFFSAVTGTVSGAFQVVMIMILTAYILFDYHRLSRSLLEVFPLPYRAATEQLLARLDRAVGGFIRGQAVIAIAVGILIFIGLTLIGLPAAGFIALLAGVLNIVPFLGSILPAIPAILLAIDGGWLQIILVVVVFVATNQVDNNVLTPMILSKSTDLHPVSVIISVVAGFALAGLLGGIAAVPVLAFCKALYTEFYKRSEFYKNG